MSECTEPHPEVGPRRRGSGKPRGVALILAAVSVGALAACDGVVGARMTFEDTETTKITEVVLTGGHGDVVVHGNASATETRIRRVIRGETNPGASYQRSGGVLTLATDCGRDCSLSYEITAPAGVAVSGEMTSGDLTLAGTGAVDLKLTSGDVMVERATGPVKVKATSGDLNVIGGTDVSLETQSGDLMVDDVTGPIAVRTTSGDATLRLAAPSSVTATVTSGDVNLIVPPGAYRVRADVHGGGDQQVIGITHDPKSANVLDLRTTSGDLSISAG
ncbi:DUF4097 family beta strand repeat-containing protein [Actinoplanes aureus]|uniref:DUF4097 family beta strand repeat protein n=1 Tax=Actinoplanes aureus TaxID=2792083 RepID=A0A931CE40_9ACTN|nr:DUF4097 family beta strand repeat-containing protein [Actinoplanes aureus]MBG0565611.1 DUF4097 family beta strand repeat protein [Actinoplanes aureus]